MVRLRTTAGLSLLALATGVAGTAWLSTLTDHWDGPPARTVASTDRARSLLRRHPRLAQSMPRAAAQTVSVTSELPALTPIDMPSPATPWFHRMAPVAGRVVLRLSVDSEGRVTQATVAETSGDVTLDDRALRTVRDWRFAVPMDHPDGLRGQLVMRYDEGTASL